MSISEEEHFTGKQHLLLPQMVRGREKRKDNENLLEVIEHLSGKLQLPCPAPESIVAVHRLGQEEGKIAPIIVRFKDKAVRGLWIRRWKDVT